MKEEKKIMQDLPNKQVLENTKLKKVFSEKKTLENEKPLERKKSHIVSKAEVFVMEEDKNAKVPLVKLKSDENIAKAENFIPTINDNTQEKVDVTLAPHIEYVEEIEENRTSKACKIPRRFLWFNIGSCASFFLGCVFTMIFLVWGVALCVYFALGLFAVAFACSCGYNYFLLESIKTITFEEWRKAEEETANLLSEEAQKKAYEKRMLWLKLTSMARNFMYGLLTVFSVIVMLLY